MQTYNKNFRTHKTYYKENLIKLIKGHIPGLNEIINTDNQVGMNIYKQVIENYPPNKVNLDPQLETNLPNNQLFRLQPTDIPTEINIIKNLKTQIHMAMTK